MHTSDVIATSAGHGNAILLRPFPSAVLFSVFFLSGFSALLYQMVWQRSLLTIYGSNVESVAMVVSSFLMGLGFGSLLGGQLSVLPRFPLVGAFAAAELGVGAYGMVSLRLFKTVGEATSVGSQTWFIGVMAFGLVFLPTLLMGATLPLLVEHQVRATGKVGQAVSYLYCVNTLGAALGAFAAVFVVLGSLGMSGSVSFAAALNVLAAAIIILTSMIRRKTSID